jgi:hypothetical protein
MVGVGSLSQGQVRLMSPGAVQWDVLLSECATDDGFLWGSGQTINFTTIQQTTTLITMLKTKSAAPPALPERRPPRRIAGQARITGDESRGPLVRLTSHGPMETSKNPARRNRDARPRQ